MLIVKSWQRKSKKAVTLMMTTLELVMHFRKSCNIVYTEGSKFAAVTSKFRRTLIEPIEGLVYVFELVLSDLASGTITGQFTLSSRRVDQLVLRLRKTGYVGKDLDGA